MVIRFAKENELIRVNELRKQVNDLHVEGKFEVFKAGFNKELQDHVYTIWKDPEQKIIVAESEGMICGFAVLHHIHKPETPFMQERDFMDIDEFCVDKKYRRQGIASEMIAFIKAYTKEQGINRMELNMWEFNEDALAFFREKVELRKEALKQYAEQYDPLTIDTANDRMSRSFEWVMQPWPWEVNRKGGC